MKSICRVAFLLVMVVAAGIVCAQDEPRLQIPAGFRAILNAVSVSADTVNPDDVRQNLAAEGLETCPVTLPNGIAPIGVSDLYADFNLSNEARTLFTIPWPDGVVVFDRGGGPGFWGDDGSLSMKWPWYRGVDGDITIDGRRLDGDAPPAWAEIPDGYGDSGFQPMGLVFPTVGCWEVTGRVGDESLTFVTLVIEVPSYFELNPVD